MTMQGKMLMLAKFRHRIGATLAALLLSTFAQAAPLVPAFPVLPPVQTGSSAVVFDQLFGFTGTGPGLATLVATLTPDGTLLSGAFSTSISGTQYSGLISDVGFEIDATGEDTIQFIVDLTGGPFLEGGLVTYMGEFGADPLLPFETGFTDFAADFSLQPLGIPLPAGLPLALAAIGSLAIVGRRRR